MRKNNGRKQIKPDKVYPKNRIGTISYKVEIPIGKKVQRITLSEFKYIHDAYEVFSKQSGFKGF